MSQHNPQCFANHLGAWLCEPQFFARALAAVKGGVIQPKSETVIRDQYGYPLYTVENGVAVISIDGVMMKQFGKYSDTSTVQTRQALRKADASNDVGAIVLRIDSPGGAVPGTMELGADVASAKKTVYAFCEDLCASAALWVASQSDRIFANEPAMIGSIGVFMVVEDTSKAYDMAGIQTHVVSTGEYKGALADGVPIKQEVIDELQGLVNATNEIFIKAIADGRGMDLKTVRALADGRMHIAADAKKLGLIDQVATFDEVMQLAGEKAKKAQDRSKNRTATAAAELRIRGID